MTKFVGKTITYPKLASAPSSPVSGDTYFNTTNNKAYIYDGTTWVTLMPAGGSMNYAQTQATKQTSISASGVTIVSASLTTNGYPVQVMVTGDAENSAAGGWIILQLYRDSTAIGKKVHVEGSAGSENVPYALTVIDTPAAGTYTYALKTASTAAAGTFNFGETDGPVLTAIELSGATDAGVTTLTGTTNQITASASTGAVTLSLPQSIATTSTPQFASIELGNASDTTLSRSAAGTLAVEGVDVVTTSAAQTLTNKTSYNKVAITAPATSATLTLADGSTLATSGANSITLTSTGATNATLPSGTTTLAQNVTTTIGDVIYASATGTPGTLARLAGNTATQPSFLSSTGNGTANTSTAFTSSTGSGNVVLATSQTLTTPVISSIVNTGTLTLPTSTDTLVGRATTDALINKTSYNKVTITAPAISATLTLADGSTLATSGAYSTTLTATGTTTLTLPTSGTVATTSNNLGAFAASTSAAIGVGSIELGAASDTTIARASAGVISVEGVTVPRMYNAALTGTGTSFTVSHGLGAIWPTVTVYDITTGKYIIPDHKVDLTSGAPSNPGTVTITFPASVTGSNYRVVITG